MAQPETETARATARSRPGTCIDHVRAIRAERPVATSDPFLRHSGNAEQCKPWAQHGESVGECGHRARLGARDGL